MEAEHRVLAEAIDTRFGEFSELDERFHRLIHNASRNRFIVDFYDVIAMIFHYHYQWNKTNERDRNAVAVHEHLDYIAALRSRDAGAVQEACRRHLTSARRTLLRIDSGRIGRLTGRGQPVTGVAPMTAPAVPADGRSPCRRRVRRPARWCSRRARPRPAALQPCADSTSAGLSPTMIASSGRRAETVQRGLAACRGRACARSRHRRRPRHRPATTGRNDRGWSLSGAAACW